MRSQSDLTTMLSSRQMIRDVMLEVHDHVEIHVDRHDLAAKPEREIPEFGRHAESSRLSDVSSP